MQIEALKIFCDVVRTSSFSRGAAENGVSQSTASQTVQQLEQRLAVKLIDRSQRPFVVTPEGKVFFEGCKEILERFANLENQVRGLVDQPKVEGTVGVAAIYSVGFHHMARYVRTFEERYPAAEARVEYQPPDRVLEKVQRGETQLGILSCPRKWPELTVTPWREEPMMFVAAPGHRFQGQTTLAVKKLDGEPFVAFTPELPIRRLIDRYLRSEQVEVQVECEFDTIENIKRAVEDGLASSILPRPCLEKELKAGSLIAIPVVNSRGQGLMRPLAIVHRKAGSLDWSARAFLDLLLQETFGSSNGSARDSQPEAMLSSPVLQPILP